MHGPSPAPRAAASDAYLQNTIIVGAGEVGQLVARKILKHREYGLNPRLRRRQPAHGATPTGRGAVHPRRRRSGSRELVELLDVERVVIAFSNDSHEETLALIRSLRDLDVQIDIVPRMFEVVGANVGMHPSKACP